MSKWLERMFYAEEPGVALGALSQSLRPLGALYGAASTRHLARARAHFGYRAKVPVISVGNYVVGGGGKTPTVLLLAQWLKKEGLRPAVLIRGYGGANKPQRIIGAIAHEQRLVVGDEASLIARRLNDVPVYVGRDRVTSAKSAQDEADVLLLDDGLQHPALQRDWDVVCFKGSRPLGNGRCLPSGPLREQLPEPQPARSTWLHITADKDVAWPKANCVFRMQLETICDGAGQPLTHPQPVHLVCGVARPGEVVKTLSEAGWPIRRTVALPDHAPIHQPKLRQWLTEARTAGCILVLTEKDFARLDPQWAETRDVRVLKAGLVPTQDHDLACFFKDIREALGLGAT